MTEAMRDAVRAILERVPDIRTSLADIIAAVVIEALEPHFAAREAAAVASAVLAERGEWMACAVVDAAMEGPKLQRWRTPKLNRLWSAAIRARSTQESGR